MPKTPDIAEQAVTFAPDVFIIPGIVMLDRELQPLDTKVFATVYWLEHLRDGKCTASNKTIGKIAGGSSNGVNNSLNRLRKQEYIVCKYDNDGNRTGINTLIQMRKGTSNEVGGVPESRYKGNNNKSKFSSEMVEQIEKVYDIWLKLMVVDPTVRAHGTTDERRAALLKAKNHTRLTELRKTKIGARIESLGLDPVVAAVKQISLSDFHRGDNESNWTATLQWLCGSDEKIEEWANKGGQQM